MRTKSELKEKLFELKKQIKLNSKDAHWTENAMRDFESLVGQIKQEPVELEVGKKEDEWLGNTFRITKTTHGVLFHTYGGYSVFCTPNNRALYETLVDYVDRKNDFSKLVGDEKEKHELILHAVAQCITLPLHVFTDPTFMYNIATETLKYLDKTIEIGLNQPLKDETILDIAKNEEYKEAEIAVRDISKMMSEDIESLKHNS